MGRERTSEDTRRFGRSATLLAAGVGSAGALTYAYFAIASHSLRGDEYGQLVIAWSIAFVLVSALFRPVEQLLSRSVAEREELGQPVVPAVVAAARIHALLLIVFVGCMLLARGPITDGPLDGRTTLYWILVATVITSGATFFVRGLLAGRGRFGWFVTVLMVESVTRLGFAIAVASGAGDEDTIALGLAVAPAFAVAVTAFAAIGGSAAGDRAATAQAQATSLTEAGGFAAALVVVMIGEQAFLNAGPLIISGTAGAAAAGMLFNVLMIVRAPLMLFHAVASTLLPHLVRLRASGGGGDPYRHAVRSTLLAVAAFAGLVAALSLTAGPELMQLAFGDNFEYERAELVVVALGTGAFLGAVTLTQSALARGLPARAALCWSVAVILFVLACVAGPGDDATRAEIAFSASAAVLFGWLGALYLSGRAGPAPTEPERVAEAEAAVATEPG